MLLKDIVQNTILTFELSGVETPALDARLLIAHALDVDRLYLLNHAQDPITDSQVEEIRALIIRRLTRESVARIIGYREFWGLRFDLNEATLEPRPDSETLIEAALKISPTPRRILDIGTGTGCLLLALLHEWPEAAGVGLDIAPRAIEQATQNAQNLDLCNRTIFHESDWLSALLPDEKFDLILSNPPYIPSDDIATLQPEVYEYDPLLALDGGVDGLDPYRFLIPQLHRHLNRKGHVLFEVGIEQAPLVQALLQEHGFQDVYTAKDLGGISRCVGGALN
ncbi:MAG: peptide chain release factor N(5)-glutamine methyltransferase [Proteobacteria bacterium]|nr:peptide chain release factor N(5)-glutamine methyltransferase [Alphaproteobacteria bacterium]NCC03542.1 peptide chain release factor N(5)-glutamine methyltransferase [Pseudomonadota bacterium]